jgi:hypothetical protein
MRDLRTAAQHLIDLHDLEQLEIIEKFGHHDDWLIACRHARDALSAALAEPVQEPDNGGKTGWPPALLQDDCRGLSKWLASRPDARQRLREALEKPHELLGKHGVVGDLEAQEQADLAAAASGALNAFSGVAKAKTTGAGCNGKLQPFERGRLPIKPRDFLAQQMSAYGVTKEQAKTMLRRLQADEVWVNDTYQVNLDKQPPHGFKGMRLWHLSIKRRDRSVVHDWRDLQSIKNSLCGTEAEAVELYPAESRLVDSANQFHLWVFMPTTDGDAAPKVPLGWSKRFVVDDSSNGAVQRSRQSA